MFTTDVYISRIMGKLAFIYEKTQFIAFAFSWSFLCDYPTTGKLRLIFIVFMHYRQVSCFGNKNNIYFVGSRCFDVTFLCPNRWHFNPIFLSGVFIWMILYKLKDSPLMDQLYKLLHSSYPRFSVWKIFNRPTWPCYYFWLSWFLESIGSLTCTTDNVRSQTYKWLCPPFTSLSRMFSNLFECFIAA